MSQGSRDTFRGGPGVLTKWIFKGSKQILEGPSMEIHYKFFNFVGLIGPSGKIS